MSVFLGAMFGSTVDTVYASTLLLDELHTFSTLRRTRILKLSFSIRFEWRRVPSRCFGCSLALRGSHLETLDFLLPVSRVELHDDGWVFSPLSAAFFGLLFGVEALPIHD